MAFCIALMILTAIIGFAPAGTTNKAWIALPGGMSLQPSELLKISMIITLAHFMEQNKEHINEVNTLIKLAAVALVPFAFVAYQRDGGTMLVYAFIIACMFFAAGISWKLIAFAGGAAVVGVPILWFKIMEPYQQNRILALIFPDNPEYKSILVQQNAGKVSYALAEQKAKEEYQKYKRLHSGELSRVEQAFLESVEATAKRLEGK
jgi:rod shape determining protein RodA